MKEERLGGGREVDRMETERERRSEEGGWGEGREKREEGGGREREKEDGERGEREEEGERGEREKERRGRREIGRAHV